MRDEEEIRNKGIMECWNCRASEAKLNMIAVFQKPGESPDFVFC